MKMEVLKVDYNTKGYSNYVSADYIKENIRKHLEKFLPNVTSCTSAVIDTKIEQAMDLVKNHLMYTMRNEVVVLKDRIVELLDRIEQLELENDFLKSNATPEVLRALSNSTATTTKYKKIEYESDMKKEDMEVAAIIGNAQHQYTI